MIWCSYQAGWGEKRSKTLSMSWKFGWKDMLKWSDDLIISGDWFSLMVDTKKCFRVFSNKPSQKMRSDSWLHGQETHMWTKSYPSSIILFLYCTIAARKMSLRHEFYNRDANRAQMNQWGSVLNTQKKVSRSVFDGYNDIIRKNSLEIIGRCSKGGFDLLKRPMSDILAHEVWPNGEKLKVWRSRHVTPSFECILFLSPPKPNSFVCVLAKE